MIVTVTPTIMDGTVVRWYAGEDAEDRGEELASASRNRVVWVKGPDSLYHAVNEVHRTLRDDRHADLDYLATHRREGLFGPLVPVGAAVSEPLVAFLRECLCADEQAAQAAERDSGNPKWASSELSDSIYTADTGSPVVSGPFEYLADGLKAHIALVDPQRMLDEVEVKRRIIAQYEAMKADMEVVTGTISEATAVARFAAYDTTLRLMTLPYRDRAGYDPAWTVE